jgi:prepilin-type N-terminal cleavage/methylation domain-containing protein
MRRESGFTLIELLIVIAIILIAIAGEIAALRLLSRSTTLSRDTEAASAILSTELAELRNRSEPLSPGSHPLPVPPAEISKIPPDASGELILSPLEGLLQAEAVIRWRSVTGPRELRMATLLPAWKEAGE